jgi:hypothetical protein
MPRHDDKPASFKEWVQQAIPGATSPEMKDAFAKLVPSKMKRAFAEIAHRFQQPFQEAQDPLPAALEQQSPLEVTPEASRTSTPPLAAPSRPPLEVTLETSTKDPAPSPATIDPTSAPASTTPSPVLASTPETSTTPTSTPAPPQFRKPGRYEQAKRAERVLRFLFPPDGKTPVKLTAQAGADKINTRLDAEKRVGTAPADEADLPPVSPDTAGRVMNKLGHT